MRRWVRAGATWAASPCRALISARRSVASSSAPRRLLQCEVICVGSEILFGEIVDTNSRYIAQRLPVLGIELVHTHHVHDRIEHLSEVVRSSLGRSDVLFVVGGLGPTMDDITRDAVARALNEKMYISDELAKAVRAFFAVRYSKPMPEINLRQAQLIPSAESLPNPRGTAPGWFVKLSRLPSHIPESGLVDAASPRYIGVLPGPPAEMTRMFDKEAVPRLRKALVHVPDRVHVVSRTIKTSGMGESMVEEALGQLMFSTNPSVGIYHKKDGIHLRLTANAASEEAAAALVKGVEQEMVAILGNKVWGYDDTEFGDSVLRLLHDRGLKLAVVEVSSGGQFCNTITNNAMWGRVLVNGQESMNELGGK